MTEQQILTVEQAAALLQVTVKTCRGLAARGVIPAFKLGKAWRFVRQELEAWAVVQAAANVRPHSRVAAGPLKPVLARPSGSSLAARLDAQLRQQKRK